ncbi:hypothetical protein BM1_10340 [Bipolaris maydis]|nr:hypothetical protein BM1_10340 [Bipolaris maydis]
MARGDAIAMHRSTIYCIHLQAHSQASNTYDDAAEDDDDDDDDDAEVASRGRASKSALDRSIAAPVRSSWGRLAQSPAPLSHAN